MASRESVDVHPAPAALAAHASCLVLRRVAAVAGAAPLRATVHANPHACLNVVVRGEVACGGEVLPRTFVCGPLSAPLDTQVHAQVQSASLVFRPWLLAPVLGVRAGALVDRLVDRAQLPSAAADTLVQACAAACDSAGHVPALWGAVDALFRPVPPPQFAFDVLLADGVLAAAAACGVSERQYRRRFVDAMGLAPAQWVRLARWERALPELLAGAAPPLGELAAGAGYADQAHLTRDTRALAGTPPARLQRLVRVGEGHWALRPAAARVRSVQDAG
jgi:AraC-like DNA-binding protein